MIYHFHRYFSRGAVLNKTNIISDTTLEYQVNFSHQHTSSIQPERRPIIEMQQINFSKVDIPFKIKEIFESTK